MSDNTLQKYRAALDGFIIDLSGPPYGVQCPECWAFALAPCRDQRRPPHALPSGIEPPGNIVRPHPSRISKAANTPLERQVRIDVKLNVRRSPEESFELWLWRVASNFVPMARSAEEVIRFAAEKWGESPEQFIREWFPNIGHSLPPIPKEKPFR